LFSGRRSRDLCCSPPAVQKVASAEGLFLLLSYSRASVLINAEIVVAFRSVIKNSMRVFLAENVF
jgi:hypothetical protein